MTLVARFERVPGGTEVALTFANLPPGLRAEDNAAGARFGLERLAYRFECCTNPAHPVTVTNLSGPKGGWR